MEESIFDLVASLRPARKGEIAAYPKDQPNVIVVCRNFVQSQVMRILATADLHYALR
jgi:hypothetical protein